MDQMTPTSRIRAGRPTKAQAEARHEELLESALDHFLEKGFELGTIEAIAQSVSMTKRTVYNRYPDKASLFIAAVRRAIDKLAVPVDDLRALDRGDLEETLFRLARVRVDRVMTPQGLKLQRIINTESYRFPAIFAMSYEAGGLVAIEFLAEVLERETKAGNLTVDDPMLTASIFMTMVVSGPVRSLVSGTAMPPDELDERIKQSVRIFLNGTRPR